MFGKLPVCLLVVATFLGGQNSGSIYGVLHNQAAVVPDATVTASARDDPQFSVKTKTDSQGAYRFAGLTPRTYNLLVEASGFTSENGQITVAEGETKLDFSLKPAAPKFAAAGVRGLIDPGGYSVPAAAASASGLVTGMADIQRHSNAAPNDWSCGVETELVKAAEAHTPAAELRLGEFYLAHRRFEDAHPHLKTAAEKDPQAQTFNLLGEAYEGSGKFSDAAAAYRTSAKLDPTDENFFAAGYELILNGSPAHAADVFRDGLTQFPQSYKLWLGEGAAEFLASHADEAVQAFLRAIEIRSSDPTAYDYLAKASDSGVQSPRADIAFRRFADLAPQNAKALYYYAVSLRRQNAGDPAIEPLLKRAIELNPDLADAHFELAAWESAKGDSDAAIREYQRAATLNPDLAQAHYRLAQAYRLAGDEQRASAELKSFEALKHGKQIQSASSMDLSPFVSVLKQSAVSPACPEKKP